MASRAVEGSECRSGTPLRYETACRREVAVRFGAAFWVNRTSWADLRDACLAAETAGWDSLWIDDHLLADEGDPDDPKLEGWSTLSALAV